MAANLQQVNNMQLVVPSKVERIRSFEKPRDLKIIPRIVLGLAYLAPVIAPDLGYSISSALWIPGIASIWFLGRD